MKAGINPEAFEELRAQSQRCLVDFLNAEIQLGFTFIEAAAYERDLGHAEHADRSRQDAGKAIASIHHFMERVANPETRDALASQCAELDRAFAAL